MNWIFTSLVMFFSSVGLYLFIRKSSLKGTPTQVNNLAMFLVPLCVYLVIGLVRSIDLTISFFHLFCILGAGIFFSYLGNKFSLKGIEYAPNPGYSLVLSKSYVVFTTLIAVVFLNSTLTLENALAVLIIVGFSALIMLSTKAKNKTSNSIWLLYSLGAFFCWGMLSLSSKYILTQGVDLFTWLIYLYFIVSGLILLEMKREKMTVDLVTNNYKSFLYVGSFSAPVNLSMFSAIASAPNVGYVNAINASSISLVTIASVVFFKDELSFRKIIGVVGVTLGLVLLLT